MATNSLHKTIISSENIWCFENFEYILHFEFCTGLYFRAWDFLCQTAWIWTNISIVNSEFIHLFSVIHPFVCSFVCSINPNMCMSVPLLFFWTALRCYWRKAQILLFSQLCFRLLTELLTVFGSGVLAVITGSARSDLSWTLTLRAKCGPQMAFMPQSPISTQQTW